jgi:hypothetical protein
VQWPLLIYGLASSTHFLLSNLQESLDRLEAKPKLIVKVFVGVMQAVLYLTFKIFFFH